MMSSWIWFQNRFGRRGKSLIDPYIRSVSMCLRHCDRVGCVACHGARQVRGRVHSTTYTDSPRTTGGTVFFISKSRPSVLHWSLKLTTLQRRRRSCAYPPMPLLVGSRLTYDDTSFQDHTFDVFRARGHTVCYAATTIVSVLTRTDMNHSGS